VAIDIQPAFPHWHFFLALDEDLERLARYIEFCNDNLQCYSLELARTLMSAAAEVDVVAQQLCERLEPNTPQRDINTYRETILRHYPQFPESTASVLHDRIGLTPWDEWAAGRNPIWWRAHNKVKHERHRHFAQATLKNALNAVGGLMVITLYLYDQAARDGLLAPSPRIFNVGHPIDVDRMAYNQTQLIYTVPNAT
jgi:hypothetical protein